MAKKKRKSRLTEEGRLRSFVLQVVRKASMRWRPINDAVKDARVGPNMYKCKACEKIFGIKEIRRDHIDPVIPVTGFDNFDGVIRRIFCSKDKIQILCIKCHDIKTIKEDLLREKYREMLDDN